MKKPEDLKKRNDRVSLYDLETPAIRKGISGWKLTKRPVAPDGSEQLFIGNSELLPIQERKKSRKKGARTGRAGEVNIDGRRIQVGSSGDMDENQLDSHSAQN